MQLKQLGLLLPALVHTPLKLFRNVKGIDRRALHRKYYRKTPRRQKEIVRCNGSLTEKMQSEKQERIVFSCVFG